MSTITRIAVTENTNAIWEYDPELPDNRVLGGSLDVLAALRTLVIKVCSLSLVLLLIFLSFFADPSIGPAHRIF